MSLSSADRFLDDLLVVIVSSMYFVFHVVHIDQKDATLVNKIMTLAVSAPLHFNPSYVFQDIWCTYHSGCLNFTINYELIEGKIPYLGGACCNSRARCTSRVLIEFP